MTAKPSAFVLALLLAFAAGAASIAIERASAEPPPAFDRALVERLVRTQEAQVHALEALTRVTERCKR